MRPIDLVVLAGGFGSRLRAAVPDVPKPLAPVAERPYLEYMIERWLEQGVTSLTFLLHYQAALIESFLGSMSAQGRLGACSLRTLTESAPLGTGGSVANAVRTLGLEDDFLVSNADTWLGSGLQLVAASPVPTIGVVHVKDLSRYGRVILKKGRVAAFGEKTGGGAGWINAGLYHLHPDLFRAWDGQPFSLEGQLFPGLAEQGHLHAAALDAEFIDIGVPEDYRRFCRWIESGRSDIL